MPLRLRCLGPHALPRSPYINVRKAIDVSIIHT